MGKREWARASARRTSHGKDRNAFIGLQRSKESTKGKGQRRTAVLEVLGIHQSGFLVTHAILFSFGRVICLPKRPTLRKAHGR